MYELMDFSDMYSGQCHLYAMNIVGQNYLLLISWDYLDSMTESIQEFDNDLRTNR